MKAVDGIVDRGPLLSPHGAGDSLDGRLLLVSVGQALEAIVPAGVRHDVGAREVTFLAAAPMRPSVHRRIEALG